MKKIKSHTTPFFRSRWKRFAAEAVAAIVAVIGGGAVFFLVFAWPAFTSRYQTMLIWGWVGWIPGGLIGYYVAGVLRRLIRRILTSAASAADCLYALISLLAIVTVTVFLINYGNINIRWQEQVQMADGNVLLLNRTAKGESPVLEGWKQVEMSLEFVELPTNWLGPPVWRTEFVPILLDYQPEGHVWSIIATFHYCDGWEKLGRPKLPYVQYQSHDGGPWKVIPLEERLIGRSTNLLTGPSPKGEPKLVTVEEKDKRNRSAANESRKIVAKWHNSCSPVGGKAND